MNSGTRYKIFIVVFILICITPFAAMFVAEEEKPSANEAAAAFPAVRDDDGGLNVKYLEEFSDWFDTRFAFRKGMITLNNTLVAAVLGESAEEKVILGRDGWLFYAETLDDYEGTNQMSEREVFSVSRSLYLMQEYCRDRNMKFLFVAAPNKNSLYGEKMPRRYVRTNEASNAERIFKRLSQENVLYADLFSPMREENKILYRRTDSHWTEEGAGFACDIILEALGKNAVKYFGGEALPREARGDLFEMLYPCREDRAEESAYTEGFDYEYSSPIRSYEDNMIRTSCEGRSGKLFMFRDSFGNTLHKFMANEFENACFCRLSPYDLTLADSVGADSVIVEIAERNLDRIITASALFPSPERDIDFAGDIAETSSLEIEKEACEIEGYTKISGIIHGELPDDEACIYVAGGQFVYEALPMGDDMFSCCIPSDCAKGNVRILTKINNESVIIQ